MEKVVFKGVGYNNECCSKFDQLVVGKEYEVEKIINQKSFLTYYILKGVEGIFHCSWFDTLKKTTLAVAHNIPVVGNEIKCFLVAFEDGKPSFTEDSIFVNEVTQVDYSMYKVNNRYLVQVQP